MSAVRGGDKERGEMHIAYTKYIFTSERVKGAAKTTAYTKTTKARSRSCERERERIFSISHTL